MTLAPLRGYVTTWIALLVLLTLTTASSFWSLGRLNLAINLAVAALKALLVLIVFMRVRKGGTMIGVAALAGIVWLAVLAGLSAVDFAWRG